MATLQCDECDFSYQCEDNSQQHKTLQQLKQCPRCKTEIKWTEEGAVFEAGDMLMVVIGDTYADIKFMDSKLGDADVRVSLDDLAVMNFTSMYGAAKQQIAQIREPE